MKHASGNRKGSNRHTAIAIRTTIMELLHTLSDLTKDDRLVLSAFESIFDSHNVRLAHSALPVRLVGSRRPDRADMARTLEHRRSVWA